VKTRSLISILFLVAALYDGLLGIGFLFGADAIFRWCGVMQPNHLGYVQFPAALLIIFAVMFLKIARNPIDHKNLIHYGILLKLSYCGVAFYHWITAGIPFMWKPFAIIDLIFLSLFIWSLIMLINNKGDGILKNIT
jgi:hypothetical protein